MLAASGISFDGEGFHLIKHLNALEIEKTKNARDFFKNWNISVYLWLKRYVFVRLLDFFVDKNGKKQALWPKILTPLIAAFWHGLYPNYYIIFFHFYLSMEMIDGILKFRNKYIVQFINLNISQVVGWYIFFFGMNYYYYILSLLDFRETIGYLSGMKYCITISLILSYIVVMFGLKIEKLIYGNILKNEKKIDETDEKTMKNE
jgi:lysophospholipid acyltransferase